MERRIKVAQLLPMAGLIMLVISFPLSAQPALKSAFKHAFYIGTALNRNQITGVDKNSVAIVKKHFNSITAENILKWLYVHPEPKRYDFAPADSFVAFGEKNKMFIVGHTLVWHNQTPRWVFTDDAGKPVDRETLLQRMKEHIHTVAGCYKGRIHGWDVVNEAVEDDGQLRQSQWLQIIGEDYLQKAFEWAREAAPQAELYYNDYNMWHAGKRQTVVRLVRELQLKGVHIGGIGMQGHWGMDYPPLDELDSMQAKLASRYAELFKILYKHRDKITRVTFWGVHDGVSWHNNWPVRSRTAYSLLFDRKYQPKPAFNAVIKIAGGE